MSFCAFVGKVKKQTKKQTSLFEFQAGDVNGDSPSSTDEVSSY